MEIALTMQHPFTEVGKRPPDWVSDLGVPVSRSQDGTRSAELVRIAGPQYVPSNTSAQGYPSRSGSPSIRSSSSNVDANVGTTSSTASSFHLPRLSGGFESRLALDFEPLEDSVVVRL